MGYKMVTKNYYYTKNRGHAWVKKYNSMLTWKTLEVECKQYELFKNLVELCFQVDPEKRPSAQDLLCHPYLAKAKIIKDDTDTRILDCGHTRETKKSGKMRSYALF